MYKLGWSFIHWWTEKVTQNSSSFEESKCKENKNGTKSNRSSRGSCALCRGVLHLSHGRAARKSAFSASAVRLFLCEALLRVGLEALFRSTYREAYPLFVKGNAPQKNRKSTTLLPRWSGSEKRAIQKPKKKNAASPYISEERASSPVVWRGRLLLCLLVFCLVPLTSEKELGKWKNL